MNAPWVKLWFSLIIQIENCLQYILPSRILQYCNIIYNCLGFGLSIFRSPPLMFFIISLLNCPPPLFPCLYWSLFLLVIFQCMSLEVFQPSYPKLPSCRQLSPRRMILSQEWDSWIFWGFLPWLLDPWPF